MDRRSFSRDNALSQRELNEARIHREYVLLALETPITGITPDIVERVSHNTGIDEQIVEIFLVQNHSNGNIEDFFLSYKELAHSGRQGSRAFELATCKPYQTRQKHGC